MRGKFPKLGKGVSECFVGGSAAADGASHPPTPIYSFPSVLILFFTLQAAASYTSFEVRYGLKSPVCSAE